MLVAAWIDTDNYCGLEYDRTQEAEVRLIHVERGERKVLARTLIRPRTYEEYFTLRVRVEGGSISTDVGAYPCRADLPIEIDRGVQYGLLHPGLGRKRRRGDSVFGVNIRNLMVR